MKGSDKIGCENEKGRDVISRVKLTVCCFLSNQRLPLSTAVHGKHRDLVACLRSEAVQHCGCFVSCYRLFPGFVGEQRLPRDSVLTDSTRRRLPGGQKAGVGDVSGHQVPG